MGLTQKILLFTSAIVVALVAISLGVHHGAGRPPGQGQHQPGPRRDARRLGDLPGRPLQQAEAGPARARQRARLQGRDPAVRDEGGETALGTVRDMLQERSRDIAADFVLATDAAGMVIARSDRPGAQGEDLSKDPMVTKPLGGEESTTVWRQGDQLFHAVSVPMAFGSDVVGRPGRGLRAQRGPGQPDPEAHPQPGRVPHHQPPASLRSSRSRRSVPRRTRSARPSAGPSWPSRATRRSPSNLGGDDYIGVQVPLKAAGGDSVGAVVALRSLSEETASFRQFRNSLVFVSLGVMALALGLAYVARHPHHAARAHPGEPGRARARRLVLRRRQRGHRTTRSESWRAPSTPSSPTCARRTR